MPKGRRYVKLYNSKLNGLGFDGEEVERDDKDGAFLVPEEHVALAREAYGLKDAPDGAQVVEAPAEVVPASDALKAVEQPADLGKGKRK